MRQVGLGAVPFIAPAESSIAMIDGTPEFEDIGWAGTGWGYPQYKLPSGPEPPADHLQDALNKARHDGFRALWGLKGMNTTGCDLQK
jgi:hypothetical protein